MLEQAIQEYLKRNGFAQFAPKAVLFDMDGVLFDSMPLHARSWSMISKEFGLDMTPEEVYLHEGRTGASTINLLTQRYWNRQATAEEIQKIYEEKCRVFNQYPEAPQMPGAQAVLEKVRENQLEQYVVTGSGQASLLNRLETNFPGCFPAERVVSSKDVKHGKPNPEPYLMGLEKAGVQPWEAIVVENAPLGVQAGVAAQIFTVAVNTGPLADAVLQEAGANWLLPSMTALAKQFKDLVQVRTKAALTD
ncbi:beta-phosphoglucomutase [gut metagenome]|uniref:Beta-phosphoglucomutase n=1 Tax=gut metagenome TaxID=749906 RepID=J9H3E1_9ZZZZ